MRFAPAAARALLLHSSMTTFVWHDLMTTDADRARGFYGELFGWWFEPYELGACTMWMIRAGDETIGTIMPEASLPASHWMPYLGAGDLDDACARVEKLGGAVCTSAKLPGLGRFAIAGDPQGGWFSLVDRSSSAEQALGPGRFGWDELATGDAHAAITFYAVLFGWTFAQEGDTREIRSGLRAIGGVRAQSMFARPAWIPSILVEDIAAATARAARLGATTAEPGVLADPSGARLRPARYSPLRYASRASFATSASETITTIARTRRAPPFTASRAPTMPPTSCAAAIGSAIRHRTCRRAANSASAARFDAKLTTLASAVAAVGVSPQKATKPTIRNVPVPGPKKPSYAPMPSASRRRSRAGADGRVGRSLAAS